MLLQAGGERLLLLRDDLCRPLRAWRGAMAESFDDGRACESLGKAGAEYADEFAEWSGSGLGRGDDNTGRRVKTGYLAVTGMMMPVDAVLRSSRVAARSVGGRGAGAKHMKSGADTAVAPAMQRTLIVREMNVTPGDGGKR